MRKVCSWLQREPRYFQGMAITLAFAVLSTVSCSRAFSAEHDANDMGYLSGFGSKADSVVSLTWGLLAILLAVVAIVIGLLIFGTFHRRPRGVAVVQHPLRLGDGLMWVHLGTGISVERGAGFRARYSRTSMVAGGAQSGAT